MASNHSSDQYIVIRTKLPIMKTIIVFLFLINLDCLAKVELRASKVHGLVKFVELLVEDHPTFWKLIDSKQHKSVREKVIQFNELKNTYLMGSFPTGAQNYKGETSVSIWSVIIWQSILSRNIKDFREKTTGLMRVHVQDKFIKIINELSVFYEPFWLKNKKYLTTFIQKAIPVLNKSDATSSLIKSIRIFYGSTWPEHKAFPIGLYLVPKNTKVMGASSFDTFEEAAIKPQEELYGRLGVIVHEMCHTYYANQQMELFKQMNEFYKSSKSPFSNHAYNYMNESLATVLGNGIFYEKMSKKVDHNWYNDKIIDGFAHSLHSLTLEYIKNNRTMDNNYFSRSIKLFEKSFPDMNKQLIYLVNKPLFSISSPDEIKNLYQTFLNVMKVQPNQISAPFIHEYTRKAYEVSSSPLVLIVSKWESESLRKVGKVYPEIISKISKIMSSKKEWSYFFHKERFHLIVKYINNKQYLAVLNKIKDKGKI